MFFRVNISTACRNFWLMIYSGPFYPLGLAGITLNLKEKGAIHAQNPWCCNLCEIPIKPRPKAKRKDPRPRKLHRASTLLMAFDKLSKQLFSKSRARLKLDRNQFSVSSTSRHLAAWHALNIATCRHCCLFIHSKTTTFYNNIDAYLTTAETNELRNFRANLTTVERSENQAKESTLMMTHYTTSSTHINVFSTKGYFCLLNLPFANNFWSLKNFNS